MWKCYSLFFISIETYFDYFDTSKVLKGVGILSLDLNNINFGNNFDEDDSNTNIFGQAIVHEFSCLIFLVKMFQNI